VKRDTKPTPVRYILENILSRNKHLRYEVKVREALYRWNDVTEEYVKNHTKAVYVKNRILYVNTESSVLANELSLREKEYIEKLNAKVGIQIIKKIVFKSGNTIQERKNEKNILKASPHLSINVLKKIDASVAHIREEELREIFRRFLRTTAKHQQKK